MMRNYMGTVIIAVTTDNTESSTSLASMNIYTRIYFTSVCLTSTAYLHCNVQFKHFSFSFSFSYSLHPPRLDSNMQKHTWRNQDTSVAISTRKIIY
ncbi:hypothetical protein RHGRI_038092 [Rhododendron griersonianum]|uniref:Uncharacterized protein n=1 Tax=Rhododendron griersonianum TaxID=479676 RepID=A0AAV6HVB0_9ERIC|nr:hypothetical protein RHGRI_038092 [Rhododendron griersonianum]